MTSTSSLQLISSGGTLTRALSRPRGCRYSPVTRLSHAGLRAIEPGPGGKRMSETTTTTPAPKRASGERTGDFRPIAAYGLLADCNSAALVDRYGSVDWLCVPRYDSDAVFARILDPDAGHWSIRPAGSYSAERRYLPGTLVLETTFTTDEGTVRLRDAMAFAPGQRGHELGFDAPHELLRSIEGVSGDIELELDVYGELLNSLWLYQDRLGELHPEIQQFVADLAHTAGRRWKETDSGMWEMRGEPRHHLSSKVLCWVALDRAVKLADQLGEYGKVEEWAAARDEIRDVVLERGWSERRRAFAQSFDSDELDAAQLLMPMLGFLPATDERVKSTIDAIADELTVACLAQAGEIERAEELFDRLTGYANDLGLLAEEIDTADNEQLGNFPQAFSHIGLIKAAYEIDKAKGAAG